MIVNNHSHYLRVRVGLKGIRAVPLKRDIMCSSNLLPWISFLLKGKLKIAWPQLSH